MLNIFTLTYRGATTEEVPTGKTREEMQRTIFARYVERMLKRRNQSTRWRSDQVICSITFLAKQMQRHDQTVFSVENLQPTWLSLKGRLFYQCCLGLFRGLVVGLGGGVVGGLVAVLARGSIVELVAGLAFGIGVGVVEGVVANLCRRLDTGINPAQTSPLFWKKAQAGVVAGVATGLVPTTTRNTIGLTSYGGKYGDGRKRPAQTLPLERVGTLGAKYQPPIHSHAGRVRYLR